ncbi:MAG: Smr/MutS family protein [Rhodobacteraceae bacterium]|nr:Smr/MutS family protein [Paracoccaceae bacterium]
MKKRRVKPEELELWTQVANTAERLHPEKKNDFKRIIEQAPQPASPTDVEPPFAPPAFNIGERGKPWVTQSVLTPTITERLSNEPLNMDRKKHVRLQRGKLKPEARLDLHGMTLDQAHPALLRFILSSQSQGRRLVLVITGKGQKDDPFDPIPRRRGVLKQQVPQWLKMAPVAQAVLQVTESHVRHGGAGAYYVYLRRNR